MGVLYSSTTHTCLLTHTSLTVNTGLCARIANLFRHRDAFSQVKIAICIPLADFYERDVQDECDGIVSSMQRTKYKG